MDDYSIEAIAQGYISHPEEMKVAFWDYILDNMEAVEDELLTFEQFNSLVLGASTMNDKAIARSKQIVRESTIQ